MIIDAYNKVEGTNIYAIGDTCLQTTDTNFLSHPQVAQVAIQQTTILKNFQLLNDGKFLDLCTLIKAPYVIGRNKAVVDILSQVCT
jgi:NADH dehydrogenase